MELDAQAIKECRPPEKQKNNTTLHDTAVFLTSPTPASRNVDGKPFPVAFKGDKHKESK